MTQQQTTVRSVPPGEVIYSEGHVGTPAMYVIKDGKVEISTTRGEKRIILSTLGKGQFFGETALVSTEPRTTTAKALTFCELQIIEAAAVDTLLNNVPPLLRHMLRTLIVQNEEKDNWRASRADVQEQPTSCVYAQILALTAYAEGNAGSHDKWSHHTGEVSLPLSEILRRLRAIMGHTRPLVLETLKRMAILGLVSLDASATPRKTGESNGDFRFVRFDPSLIVERAQQLAEHEVETGIRGEQELIELVDLEALVGVERKLLLKKLAQDEIADSLFTFRKSEVLRFISEKGRPYFARRQSRAVYDLESLDDLEFVDHRTLFEAVAGMDTYDLAKLVSGCNDSTIKERLLAAMSKSKRQEIETLSKENLGTDVVELQHIEDILLDAIRATASPASSSSPTAGGFSGT